MQHPVDWEFYRCQQRFIILGEFPCCALCTFTIIVPLSCACVVHPLCFYPNSHFTFSKCSIEMPMSNMKSTGLLFRCAYESLHARSCISTDKSRSSSWKKIMLLFFHSMHQQVGRLTSVEVVGENRLNVRHPTVVVVEVSAGSVLWATRHLIRQTFADRHPFWHIRYMYQRCANDSSLRQNLRSLEDRRHIALSIISSTSN